MSSETVSGNALQFTNDNKRCFAYSGVNDLVDNTETTLLEFETLESDLNGTVQFNMVQDTADNKEPMQITLYLLFSLPILGLN